MFHRVLEGYELSSDPAASLMTTRAAAVFHWKHLLGVVTALAFLLGSAGFSEGARAADGKADPAAHGAKGAKKGKGKKGKKGQGKKGKKGKKGQGKKGMKGAAAS